VNALRPYWALGLVIAFASCQSGPTETPQSTATRASPPVTPSAPVSAIPSTPPTTVDLPAGLDAIAWAHMPIDPDANEVTVAIGVLGKLRTTTRSYARQPSIWANGSAVIIDSGDGTEIVDAATGRIVATYDMAALELAGVPEIDLDYYVFGRRFLVDFDRGYLYFMSANPDGVHLRRFALDGSDETLLAVLAPDPGRQLWTSDFSITPAGDVVATACPLVPSSMRPRAGTFGVAASGSS